MKNNIKNCIITLIVFIIILLSFTLPNILFQIEDLYMENNIFTKKSSSKIDVETSKIYLVKAIHEIENGSLKISAATDISLAIAESDYFESENTKKETIIEKVKNELQSLEENKILENLNYEKNIEVSVLEYNYINNENEYTKKHIFLENKEDKISFDIEKKTGKIISIAFNKNNLNKNIDRKEILENYIKYLNLYIIDDWTFEDNKLKSEKAGLYVSIIYDNSEQYILSIYSNNRNFNNLIYYE